MPADGPQSMDIRSSQAGTAESLPYMLVKLTPEVVRVLGRYTPRLSTAFADKSPPKAFRFGIGDTVSVTIFEAAAGGLFIPAEAGVRPGNFVTIPNQSVDDHGNITVPYAGSVVAKGRTPAEIQHAIVDALKSRAIEPQVVVSLILKTPRSSASSATFTPRVASRRAPPANASSTWSRAPAVR